MARSLDITKSDRYQQFLSWHRAILPVSVAYCLVFVVFLPAFPVPWLLDETHFECNMGTMREAGRGSLSKQYPILKKHEPHLESFLWTLFLDIPGRRIKQSIWNGNCKHQRGLVCEYEACFKSSFLDCRDKMMVNLNMILTFPPLKVKATTVTCIGWALQPGETV